MYKIRQIFTYIILKIEYFNEGSIKFILQEKYTYINQNNILELYDNTIYLKDISGITLLKKWLYKRSTTFSTKSYNYGLPFPKGLLLVGIQGTGKSLTAKAIASEWNLLLLKLDIGKIFNSILGKSEAQIRKMIMLVEASSPCVLCIDEIDKTFSNLAYNNDSGTSNRVFSTLLTWLSEKNSQVFVVATVNNILNLPTEILRKGRFDEVFFINLPHLEQRKIIFQIHLSKIRPYTWHKYNIKLLAQYSNSFSGAEIEQAIIDAMYTAFDQNRESTSHNIVTTINTMIPLAFTDKKNIQILQKWVQLGKLRSAC